MRIKMFGLCGGRWIMLLDMQAALFAAGLSLLELVAGPALPAGLAMAIAPINDLDIAQQRIFPALGPAGQPQIASAKILYANLTDPADPASAAGLLILTALMLCSEMYCVQEQS